ncbi:MAG: ASPIC/UnbV domain-containing protein [Saprospiraceae bacterium]|nr:ASPIC/UnbV domain-containing protein [Saprospiraceae bacterium]
MKIGNRSLMDEVNGGNSWASQSSLMLHFGLGSANSVDLLTICWPSGIIDSSENVAANKMLEITEGESKLSNPEHDPEPSPSPNIDPNPVHFIEGHEPLELTSQSDVHLSGNEVRLMPNPFLEEVVVVLNEKALQANVLKISLLDGLGREMIENEVKGKSPLIRLDTKAVPPGLYYLQIVSEQGAITKKVMKL